MKVMLFTGHLRDVFGGGGGGGGGGGRGGWASVSTGTVCLIELMKVYKSTRQLHSSSES